MALFHDVVVVKRARVTQHAGYSQQTTNHTASAKLFVATNLNDERLVKLCLFAPRPWLKLRRAALTLAGQVELSGS